jgi:signal peptidase I
LARERASGALRELLEALTLALLLALVFKHLALEPYRIPSGSMQPTLMGSREAGVFDRILVDKLSYRWREPRRFEVVVFRFPLDRSRSFVKRIAGLPGEQLRLHLGDLWVRADENEPWRIPRRPREVERASWKALEPARPDSPPWSIELGAGEARAHDLRLAAGARAAYRPERGAILDGYADGYPDALRPLVRSARGGANEHPVGDLRVDGELEAAPECAALEIELLEGALRYRMLLPGPAAASGARARIEVHAGAQLLARVEGDELRLPAGRSLRFGAQNLDDLLELELDGRVLAQLAIEPQEDQRSGARLAALGGALELRGLMLRRDIWHVSERAKVSEASVPLGQYFMLGDNTQDSSDSREWTLRRHQVFDPLTGAFEGRIVRGHWSPAENPVVVQGGLEGPVTWFRDEFGERHRWLEDEQQLLTPLDAPFVPRSAIVGRAFAIFWPIDVRSGVARVGWIH